MSIWDRLKPLSPAWRRREERDMREELEALESIAGRKQLGNMTLAMENARANWGWTWLDGTAADLRYALRTLRNQPGFFLLAVLSLALAIGANSAVFSFADALLFRPLPVPDPSGLLDIAYAPPDNALEGTSFPDFRDLRDASRSFAGLAAYRLTTLAAAPSASATARIRLGMLVSNHFFRVVGVAPMAGRDFLDEEASPPGQPRALISYDFWQEQYNRDPAAIGRTLRLNGVACTIVGILPESFTGLDRFARPTIFIPLAMAQRLTAAAVDPLEDRSRHDLIVKGRLSAGATKETAQAELGTLGSALEREYPKTNHNRRFVVRTELSRRIQQTPQLLSLIKMMMGLVGLILIVACSNVANLLLARARARGREIAIRLSIGAGRARLMRQFITESLLLALAGGAVGLLFAAGGVRFLESLSVPSEPPSVLGAQFDWRVAQFSLAAALVSCLLFGLAPAWHTTRLDFVGALKSGGQGSSGQTRSYGRDALVVGQIALAMVVLVAAGMFLAGFRRMLVLPPDFRTDHILTMDTAPAMLHYSPELTHTFYRELAQRVAGIPGVERVAMAESFPLSTSQTTLSVVPEGYQFPKGEEKTVVFGGCVDAHYFSTLNVRIVRGRAFTEEDRAGSRRVAIVNEQFAKTYWPGQDALGRRIRLDSADGPAAEVVGVAKTGHYLLVNEAPASYVYLPYEQNPRTRMTLIAESAGDPAALAAPLRETVRTIDADMPVFNLRTAATLYDSRATGTWLQFFQMVGTMGFIGLVLAMTGLYGLVSYTVSRRVKEFGIRAALGAREGDVVWLVERRGMILAAVGIATGAALTAAAVPLLAAAFPGIGESPAPVYTLVPFFLITVSAAASYVPARRASRLDPLRTLRDE